MKHPLIDVLAELECAAAQQFWQNEDRSVWKDDLLRQSEHLTLLSLKNILPALTPDDKTARTPVPIFSTTLWDNDLHQYFVRKSQNNQVTETSDGFQITLERLRLCDQASLLGIMLRPGFWLTECWPQQEELLRSALRNARDNQALVFRMGFLQHQADILLAADLGFTGIQIHAGQLDLYELQMALELARDCKLCPIVSVGSDAEMEQVIQTDAPHIALCHFPTEGQQSSLPFLQRTLPKFPNNCTRLLFTAGRTEAELQLLSRLGFQAMIHFGT